MEYVHQHAEKITSRSNQCNIAATNDSKMLYLSYSIVVNDKFTAISRCPFPLKGIYVKDTNCYHLSFAVLNYKNT